MTLKKWIHQSILLIAIGGSSCTPVKKFTTVPKVTGQMILVITDSIPSASGNLYSFERSLPNANWKPADKPVPVTIGRNGLGMGIGLHQPSDMKNLPRKEEGDGRSPAGAFTLGLVFGYSPKDHVSGIKMPYLHITEMIECIDDAKSTYYNQIVSKDTLEKTGKMNWQSSEKMSTVGIFYEMGVVVNHNQNPAHPGCGSCIFLHNWSSPTTTTSGCTSMAPENMKRIASWLDPTKNPILVQLPHQLYLDLKKQWKLPEIPSKEKFE